MWLLDFLRRYLNRFAMLVAEVGFEPHDLRVMSPTSYQAALLRDIYLCPLLSAYALYHYYYMFVKWFYANIFMVYNFLKNNLS